MRKVFIIAEAGVNHNGSMKTAEKLIDIAANAKCDAIKFQTFKAENLTSTRAEKCDYQVKNGDKDNQLNMLKKLELPYEWHKYLIEYANKRNLIFLSTAFDIESAVFLNSLNMDIFKIPSGEIDNVPLLETINSFGKKVILSTGMATVNEIKFAVDILQDCDVSILHCNTQYPTGYEDVNLLAMNHIKKETGKIIGYSDHTIGIEVAIAAVALGAEIIEKHITLDRNLDGPDHFASIEPNELLNMVNSIRNIEMALGTGIKQPTESELLNIFNVRKSIVAKNSIKKGEVLTEKNITAKRPLGGIPIGKWHSVIGTIAGRDYKADDMIVIE